MSEQQTEKTEQPAAMPVARLKDAPGREKMVPLQYPVIFGDQEITEIRVRRCTGKEVQDYIARLGASEKFEMLPVIDCPEAVWDALDADDQDTVGREAEAFFPRRLRAVAELILANGEATSASSPTSTAGLPQTSSEKTG